MAEQGTDFFGSILSLGTKFGNDLASKFSDQIVYGRDNAAALQAERLQLNAMQGNGPTDPRLSAQTSPLGPLEWLFGKQPGRALQGSGNVPAAQSGGGMSNQTIMLVAIGAAALLAAFFYFRK